MSIFKGSIDPKNYCITNMGLCLLCLDKSSLKGQLYILLSTADCIQYSVLYIYIYCVGNSMAPGAALMPLIIICNTQLSL